MLMPIAIIGAYFQLMRNAVFSPDSFIYNVLNFDETMPDDIWYAGAFISSGMVRADGAGGTHDFWDRDK